MIHVSNVLISENSRSLSLFQNIILNQGRRSIFRIWGGGGGKSKEKFKFFGALRAQSRNIKLCAQSAPQNLILCMFSSIFHVKFYGFVVSDSVFKTYSCITYY